MATYGQLIQFGPIFNGGVLNTIKVYHYVSGTTTLKDVYTDREKTTTAAQPVVSDANGIVSFYADGLYKFNIYGATDGATYSSIYTYDKWAVVDQSQTLTGEGSSIASATTLVLGTDGNFFHVTGSTGPIGILSGTQQMVTLVLDSTPTFTHSGTLILQNAENYTAIAGDTMQLINESGGVWREVSRRSASMPISNMLTTVQALPCDLRLTLTAATPVYASDVTAAETLYFTPYTGNRIALYDGTRWNIVVTAQVSIDIPDVTGVHDVFCYNSSGVATLEVLVWTNDSTRATNLAYVDGVLVKSTQTTRRYLGSFYSTTAGNGQVEDSVAKRNLWNNYNRVSRVMQVVDTTNSWTYTTATYHQANAAATNQVEYTVGVAEDSIEITVMGLATNSASGVTGGVGVGIDSTTVNSAQINVGMIPNVATIVAPGLPLTSRYRGIPAAGRHTIAWLEISAASGTTTWYGDNGLTYIQSGLIGEVKS